jgi:hypothetical protein
MTTDKVVRETPATNNGDSVMGRNPSQQSMEEQEETLANFVWEMERGARRNYYRLGKRLAVSSDLFRNRADGLGLIQVLPSGKTRTIKKGAELAPIIADRMRMQVTKESKIVSELPQATHLNAMLRAEIFLSQFRPVDHVVTTPFYLPDFSLVQPGYHDYGPGKRILYNGATPNISNSTETIDKLLDVIEFHSASDRANCLGAALTVLLRHHWPGHKAVILITASRSFAGKGTLTEFISGITPRADILYENVDWPMHAQFQKQLRDNPDIGLVVFDNVRLDSAGGHSKFIRSSFIESLATKDQVTLAAPSASGTISVENTFVLLINTNDGVFSLDIMNRSFLIHLTPRGDIEDRNCPIGDPKNEFIPKNRDQIVAELRGFIERWRQAGCPLDEEIKHPMKPWASTISGILRANGVHGFLANSSTRKMVGDPVLEALAILGGRYPGKALRPEEWARAAVKHGFKKVLFSTPEGDTEKGRERLIGVLFSKYLNVKFSAKTETRHLDLRLEGGLKRWIKKKNAHCRYIFVLIREEALPLDEPGENSLS